MKKYKYKNKSLYLNDRYNSYCIDKNKEVQGVRKQCECLQEKKIHLLDTHKNSVYNGIFIDFLYK